MGEGTPESLFSLDGQHPIAGNKAQRLGEFNDLLARAERARQDYVQALSGRLGAGALAILNAHIGPLWGVIDRKVTHLDMEDGVLLPRPGVKRSTLEEEPLIVTLQDLDRAGQAFAQQQGLPWTSVFVNPEGAGPPSA